MSTQPDEPAGAVYTTPRGTITVERRAGTVWCGSFAVAEDLSAHEVRKIAREDYEPGSDGENRALAVADFLDAEQQRAQHADAVDAFPDDTPPPRRPRVALRQQVDVDGVEVADVVVRVHPSAPDTEAAVINAARALHDAALAVVRVLAVEPADRAGASS